MWTRREVCATLLGTCGGLIMTNTEATAARTRIVPFKTSPFPYEGIVPSSGLPFLDAREDGERGHTSPRGGVYLEDDTYKDRSVLLAIAPSFTPRRAVIVVYLHGNQCMLLRDVVERQQVVAQLVASRLDAVLVAPQFAVDALDSSAGHFWDPGGFQRFMDEAARKLAAMSGVARGFFSRMPIVLVAYSGGYNAAAAILRHGHVGDRLAGIVLMDALYGEQETFTKWIMRHRRRAFFFSAFSESSAKENIAFEEDLKTRGITLGDSLPDKLKPGVIAFVPAGDVPHNDFLTKAWMEEPLRVVLARVAR